MKTINQLIDEWTEFCNANNIENVSADEINTDELTDEQRQYVENFISEWDEAE